MTTTPTDPFDYVVAQERQSQQAVQSIYDDMVDEHPTPATAVDLIRDALALVDGLADEVLPRIRRGYVLTAPQHVDAVRDVEQKVAEAWAALTMARTWLEDIR